MPFKIYADFESLLKVVKSSDENNNTSYAEKYQAHIPCSFAHKVFFFFKMGKNAVNRFIETILEEYDYCRKVIKKHFNKNLVMSAEDEQIF